MTQTKHYSETRCNMILQNLILHVQQPSCFHFTADIFFLLFCSVRLSWLCVTIRHLWMKKISLMPSTSGQSAGYENIPQIASTTLARFPLATASGAASAGE